MLNLALQALPGNNIKFERRKNNLLFKKIAEEIALAANYHCQYCGIFCQGWHTAVNIDGDYSNNRHSNLTVACKLCAGCLLMDQYTVDYVGENKLIFLPEVSQTELNLAAVAMARMVKSGGNKEYTLAAKTLYSSLSGRSDFLKNICSSDLSHPSVFLFINSNKDNNHELVSGIRLMFSFGDLDGICCD
ncbi:hypothetical protein AVI51_04140 [Piscirickettsia salmonis]|uniref:Intracellular multiplication protein IcmJ n=1 Tax=Piscirickettsia salmonis TaxID=1238 RepID=A0A9Q5YM18_PISSA|nr:type IVB secretion system protein IcmJDotN [Piscirickettsia salmonis]ALA25297.1 type IV secretion system protein IcmJ [Piscirickettsia salmonis]APS45533.1 hypothetical protein AVI48_14895 [Piscirickettsia salmonis]APS46190.1 hypothetical protein AVI49_00115 [Piscirickettsia salmonis]APS50121.1 hypothetical protein AVI50_04180 [Piscirickettsia salmonis]APS53321.1 hypothetical protein AVI51_04140 [Piscirickettsia salmonis]